eukprot:TRINITY_DN26479_c0_g2_i1.p1 TRINITY_DN26479_c0_g2~~TRINITY_DN26479_c0_g2_i1.p1  ORF type:complete len:333 (+),score=56.64 TRINITY_DN26479_c0_g2_i1:29-1027(+)
MAGSEILTLDVGGTRMKTMRSTLCKYQGSMLAKMFNSKAKIKPAQTEDGAYFLDRDPDTFKIVLTFLRSGKLNGQLTKKMLEDLETEADYLLLTSLKKVVESRLKPVEDSASFMKFEVAGKVHKVSKQLFGNLPMTVLASLLAYKLGDKIYVDNDKVVFFDTEAFALLINSLTRGKDDLTKRGSPEMSKLVRYLLFFKKCVYSGRDTVKIKLDVSDDGARSEDNKKEREVSRDVLCKDLDSQVTKHLTDLSQLPLTLTPEGILILKCSQSLDKVLALFEEMKYSSIMLSTSGHYVDEMSKLAREIGVLSDNKILTSTQFVRSTTPAAKRARE